MTCGRLNKASYSRYGDAMVGSTNLINLIYQIYVFRVIIHLGFCSVFLSVISEFVCESCKYCLMLIDLKSSCTTHSDFKVYKIMKNVEFCSSSWKMSWTLCVDLFWAMQLPYFKLFNIFLLSSPCQRTNNNKDFSKIYWTSSILGKIVEWRIKRDDNKL